MIHPRVHLYRRLFVILLWLMAIVLMLALTITHNPPAEMRAMAAHWAEMGPSHYHYTLATSRYGAAPLIPVEVEDGRATYPRLVDGAVVPLADNPSAYTIDWLFRQIEAELERGAEITHSRYDLEYGYPREITLDYEDRHDRWVSYAVIDFTVLD
jgi:hypothetical protein